MKNISILGGGTWGIALARLAAKNGHNVTIWSALTSEVEMLSQKREHDMLPGVVLPESITITADERISVTDKDLIVMAVASRFTRATAQKIAPYITENQIIVNVAKGIEDETLMTLAQIIEQEIPQADVCVLSGPSHAEEVGKDMPTTVVVGARTRQTAEFIQDIFMCESFRVYTSPDILGIELGGSLKNVVALAAGMADGLGYGDNAKAALITRGIAEISRLGVKMGGKPQTFAGLTGIGDLIVTCASMHSRNRRAGILMGQGKSMQEAMDEVHMVVEGVYSAKAAIALAAKYEVDLPIIEQVNHILFDNKNAGEAVKELMIREKRSEIKTPEWD